MTAVRMAVSVFMIMFIFNGMLLLGTQAGLFSQLGSTTDTQAELLPNLNDGNFITKTTEIFKFIWKFVFIEFYGFPPVFTLVLFMIKAIGSFLLASVIRGTS